MTSHKLCLTALVLAAVSVTVESLYDPSNHRRDRRANAEDERPTESPSFASSELEAGYRFGDEYFLPEASKAIPKKHKKADGCERVVRDSMVCMVCKEPKTNAKYEQCSYVVQPNEKAFSYEKSRAFGNPDKSTQSTKANEDSDGPESSGEAYEPSEPARYKTYQTSKPTEASYSSEDGSRAPSGYSATSGEESENYGDPAESSDCRRVEKDGKTCTLCRDPKTGNDVERCSSKNRQPDDGYSSERTVRYGYPESHEDKEEYGSRQDDKNSESSEDPAETSDCRQVRKNGQTCSVCRDPKTGSDLERCSSSYRPDDKAYAYGKSEKYGYPHSDDENDNYETRDDEDKSAEASASYESSPSKFQAGYLKSNDDYYRRYHEAEPEEFRKYDEKSQRESPPVRAAPSVAAETKQPSGATGEASDCREVKKDSMTCTVCTDPKTGGNFQKCSYAYQPSDKVYKFSKSKTFGYPETLKSGDNGGAESESKRVPKTVKAGPCRQVQRDSKTCEVCEDPVTGESSEQCKYSYKPKDKHFAFSKSRSFGEPRKDGKEEREGGPTEHGPQESRQVQRWTDEGEKKNSRSEQKADAAEASPCRQVIKDSMTCTVCKDPKSGASSEQCAYSSEPKEKLFTYSRSKTVGRPRKNGPKRDDGARERGPEESRKSQSIAEPEDGGASKKEVRADSANANPCREVSKDSMTCTICKDPETGENSEQCSYSSQPKKRHFTYSKSKSFGSPRKSDEARQESQLVPQSSGDEWRRSAKRSRGTSKSERGLGL